MYYFNADGNYYLTAGSKRVCFVGGVQPQKDAGGRDRTDGQAGGGDSRAAGKAGTAVGEGTGYGTEGFRAGRAGSFTGTARIKNAGAHGTAPGGEPRFR